MLEIYLIRHGLTPWNAEKRFQGHKDIALSDEGIEQAKRTRDRLQDLHFDAVYSSDLQRAYQTAQIIAKPHGIPVTPVPELREIHMGDWEGLTREEVKQGYANIFSVWRETPTRAEVPHFEGIQRVATRASQAFQALAEKHQDDERILIVSHGMLNAIILTLLNEGDLDQCHQVRQGNTAVNIITYDGKQFTCTLINSTTHCDNQETKTLK